LKVKAALKVNWADLNERQQEYMQAIYETDQEQEADERGMWKRGFITCKYTHTRRNGEQTFDSFLMLQITKEGRALVRSATGAKAYRPGAPGTLKEWHWKALAEAWKGRPAGVQQENGYYGHIGWNTWLRLRDYKPGALVEEYRTGGPYLAHVGYSVDIHWIRLTPFGELFYRDNWQTYNGMYPEVDAPQPEEQTTESE